MPANKQVRRAFLDAVAGWLVTLRERADHAPRLLPYILAALSDDTPSTVAAAMCHLDVLGAAHEVEHAALLADAIRFGEAASGGAERAWATALQQARAVYGGSSNNSGSNNNKEVFFVPGPFTQRPRLGTRRLVAAHLAPALHALCAELSSWQTAPRASAARLLVLQLVLAEDAAARHAQVGVVAMH